MNHFAKRQRPYDLEVAVKGYQPIKPRVGMYSVTKQQLN